MKTIQAIEMTMGSIGDTKASIGQVLEVPKDCSLQQAKSFIAREMAKECKPPKAEKPTGSKG